MDIRPADLILVRGSGLIAEGIKLITHSPYSHVAGLVKPNEIFEAQGGRETGYNGLDFYAGCSDVFTCDVPTDEQRQRIVDHVVKEVGTKYDYALIAWELGHYILHIDLPFHESEGRRDCMMIWVDAYRSVGIDPFPSIKFPVPGDVPKSTWFKKVGAF